MAKRISPQTSVIATSGPSSSYPQRVYRNPTDALVQFLDLKYGTNWAIWQFRAEGTGYPDEDVYGRIHHLPWPDHHPPPFALIPPIVASMRNWLHGGKKGSRVVVVHCKAGKGRSGTVACSYLVSEREWKAEDAMRRFTERRMRVGFGPGVSVQSQIRWIGYVDRWTNEMGKTYVERPVEIIEVHIWGLRDGVKVEVEGYVEEGREIQCFHRFHRKELTAIMDDESEVEDEVKSACQRTTSSLSTSIADLSAPFQAVTSPKPLGKTVQSFASFSDSSATLTSIPHVILKPNKGVIIPTSDVDINIERRAKANYTGWVMTTSIAHVWFNAYFEGGSKHDSGAFETEWGSLDGIKGSSNKGAKALDRIKVVWRYPASPLAGEGKPEEEKAGAVEGR